MQDTNTRTTDPVIPPERLKDLADGVFAIVMTILVLELAVPVVAESSTDSALLHALLAMWIEVLIYFLSFLILGMFWLIHHMIFDAIRKFDSAVVWLNIIYLMFVSLIPFSTSMYSKYAGEQITAIIYGVNQLLAFLMGFAIWSYATGNHRLVDEKLDPGLIRRAKIMGYVYFSILVIAIGLSFVHPLITTLMYAAIVTAFILMALFGRVDIVTVWRGVPGRSGTSIE